MKFLSIVLLVVLFSPVSVEAFVCNDNKTPSTVTVYYLTDNWLTLEYITKVRNRLIEVAGGEIASYPPPEFHYQEKPLAYVKRSRKIVVKEDYNWSKTRLRFVLAHEVCHVELGHTDELLPDRDQALKEQEASTCAAELMRRYFR